MEELAVPQRLGQAVGEVEAGHLLVADLGVDADELRVLQGLDERQRMTHGGQQDVAARLVGLGLQGEHDRVALVEHVLAEHVERLLVAIERSAHVLGRPGLRSLPTTPGDERAGADSAARSRLSATLRMAKRRTSRSLFVDPPSRKTGCQNKFVVTIGTTNPVSARADCSVATWRSRSAAEQPKGKTSLSSKLIP